MKLGLFFGRCGSDRIRGGVLSAPSAGRREKGEA